MNRIRDITSDAKQKHKIILDDGSTFVMYLEYKSLQAGWFVTKLTHGTFEINNVRIVTSPNFLHQFKNQIPFGLGVFVNGDQEPTLKNDFLSGRAKLMVLTRDEVELFGDYISGQVTT